MDQSVSDALRDLIAKHGRALLDDPRRCEALLRDHCPDARREITVLMGALKEGVPQRLLGLPPASLSEATVTGYAARLSEELAMAEQAARWSIMTWAGAFRLKIDEKDVVPGNMADIKTAAAVAAVPAAAAAAKPIWMSRKWQIVGGIAAIVIGGIAIMQGAQQTSSPAPQQPAPQQPTPAPQPAPAPVPQPAPAPAPQPAPVTKPAPAPQPAPKPAQPQPQQPTQRGPVVPDENYADEHTNFGVPPQNVLQANVGTPTPTVINGGRVVSTSELATAMNSKWNAILIDAWNDNAHTTLPGAHRFPLAGSYGNFNDAEQQNLFNQLGALTNRNVNVPLVFFCEGSRCWESYNAVLRALHMGFKDVYWYRGGVSSWEAAGLPLFR